MKLIGGSNVGGRAVLILSLLAASAVVVSPGATKAVVASESARPLSSDEVDFFEKKIRPVLVQHCYSCHSNQAKSPEGGLRLDSRTGVLKGGDDGPVIVPGKPEASNLVKAIRYGNDFSQMPPKGKLPAEAIADFERWIASGAADPRTDGPALTKAPDKHWAFQPPRRAPRPRIQRADWPQNEIDHFVLARLEERELSPAADADRGTLIRRLSFDLIGLPPTFSEVESFVKDRSPQALEKVIDRLLASPHFGERWARHWLDVARYADTKGYVFQEDRNYPEAYTYRDWVIQAFNEDMPYDRFVVAQIAGDQATTSGGASPLAAMGFLTLGRRFINNIHDIIDDRIDVVSRGTMGLTVGCARCHDHKFDPIPTKDYYSLYGVFASSLEPNNAPSRLRLIDAPQPHNARVFLRGNPSNPGEEVPRRFLQVLAGENRKPFQQGSGRLELAQAIVRPDNPLTARVIVNRIWGHLFGTGLVRTPSDFGTRCDPPTHPELLDDLALQFVDQGWSVKKLIRRIVLSRTYRQRSEDRPDCSRVDPENCLLWKMNRRRLDFESLRDAILSVSGKMDNKVGGPSVFLTATPFTNRRTLYAFIDRQNLPGLFRTFDFASPDTHSPQRFNTTVPQQALFLMNNPFVLEQSEALVRRPEMGGVVDPQRRIALLYQLVYARQPSADEINLGLEFVTRNSGDAAPGPQPSHWEGYAQVLILANEFAFVD
jgi:hypothetical protein